MRVLPTTLKQANDYVQAFHRHSGRTARDGGKFAVKLVDKGRLVGVAIVGNPVSASLMDGCTAEVLRVCVEPNAPLGACSMLYGAAWRTWRSMGGTKMVTYTLQTETGASLRGAGWVRKGETKGHNDWASKSRMDGKARTQQIIYRADKYRWEVQTADHTAAVAEQAEFRSAVTPGVQGEPQP